MFDAPGVIARIHGTSTYCVGKSIASAQCVLLNSARTWTVAAHAQECVGGNHLRGAAPKRNTHSHKSSTPPCCAPFRENSKFSRCEIHEVYLTTFQRVTTPSVGNTLLIINFNFYIQRPVHYRLKKMTDSPVQNEAAAAHDVDQPDGDQPVGQTACQHDVGTSDEMVNLSANITAFVRKLASDDLAADREWRRDQHSLHVRGLATLHIQDARTKYDGQMAAFDQQPRITPDMVPQLDEASRIAAETLYSRLMTAGTKDPRSNATIRPSNVHAGPSNDSQPPSLTPQTTIANTPTSSGPSANASRTSSALQTPFDEAYQDLQRRQAKHQRREQERLAGYQTAESFVDEHGFKLAIPDGLGPLPAPTDDARIITYKSWMRAIKTLTTTLQIPFATEIDLPTQLRMGKSTPKAIMATVVYGHESYNPDNITLYWLKERNETLILPPPVTHYDGWPEIPYSFHHHHGVQELNFPWTEFLYAFVPSGDTRIFQFAKFVAAFGAYGLIIESADNDDAEFYRLRFRSLQHLLWSLLIFIVFKRDEQTNDYVYADYRGTRVRQFECCYGLPLIFNEETTIRTNTIDAADSSISAQLYFAIEILYQRMELMEDKLPDDQKPCWWKPPADRFTPEELFYWLSGEENRQITEKAWDHFNSKAIYRFENLPVTIVSVTPAAGRIEMMTASKYRVYYQPNALTPITEDVKYSTNVAGERSYINNCKDVFIAYTATASFGEKQYAIDHITHKAVDRDLLSPLYHILPKMSKEKREDLERNLDSRLKQEWHEEVIRTYACHPHLSRFAVPIRELPSDLKLVMHTGEFNKKRYDATVAASEQPGAKMTIFERLKKQHAENEAKNAIDRQVAHEEAARAVLRKKGDPLPSPKHPNKHSQTVAMPSNKRVAPSKQRPRKHSEQSATSAQEIEPSDSAADDDEPLRTTLRPSSHVPPSSHDVVPSARASKHRKRPSADVDTTPTTVQKRSRKTPAVAQSTDSTGSTVDVQQITLINDGFREKLRDIWLLTNKSAHSFFDTLGDIYTEMDRQYNSLCADILKYIDQVEADTSLGKQRKTAVQQLRETQDELFLRLECLRTVWTNRRMYHQPSGSDTFRTLPKSIRDTLCQEQRVLGKAIRDQALLRDKEKCDLAVCDGDLLAMYTARCEIYKVRHAAIQRYISRYDAHNGHLLEDDVGHDRSEDADAIHIQVTQPTADDLSVETNVQPVSNADPRPSRTTRLTERPSTRAAVAAKSDTSLKIFDIRHDLDDVALLTRTEHTNRFCTNLEQLYSEMYERYARLKLVAQNFKLQLENGEKVSGDPELSITTLTDLISRAMLFQDTVQSLRHRQRFVIEPLGEDTPSVLPKSIQKVITSQCGQLDEAIQQRTARIATLLPSQAAECAMLLNEKIVFQTRHQALDDFLNHYTADGKLRLREPFKNVVFQYFQQGPTQQHQHTARKTITRNPRTKTNIGRSRAHIEQSDEENAAQLHRPLGPGTSHFTSGVVQTRQTDAVVAETLTDFDTHFDDDRIDVQPTVTESKTTPSPQVSAVIRPSITAVMNSTSLDATNTPASDNQTVAQSVFNVRAAPLTVQQTSIAQNTVATDIRQSNDISTRSQVSEPVSQSASATSIAHIDGVTSTQQRSLTVHDVHDDDSPTVYVTGVKDRPLTVTDVFGVSFAFGIDRLRTLDIVCGTTADNCVSHRIPAPLNYARHQTAPSCSYCDGAHLSTSCLTLFTTGWPIITDDGLQTMRNNDDNDLINACPICDSPRHAGSHCPIWHADLILYHDLYLNLHIEATSHEYLFDSLTQTDASRPFEYLPTRDELQLTVYGGDSTVIPPSYATDIDEGDRAYFNYYGSALENRPVADRNLKQVYELLLEWHARTIERAVGTFAKTTILAELSADYAKALIIWAALHNGCLIRISDLPPSMNSVLKPLTDRLHADSALHLWIHPDRQTVGWAEVRSPNNNRVFFDASLFTFNQYATVSQSHSLVSTVALTRFIDRPTYDAEFSTNKAALNTFLDHPSASKLVTQWSFLAYYEREQPLLTSATFRPSHAHKMLCDYGEFLRSTRTLCLLAHFNTWLTTRNFDRIANLVVPRPSLLPASTLDSIDRNRALLIRLLDNLGLPFATVRINYHYFTVEGPSIRGKKITGQIRDYPNSISVIDEKGNELDVDEAVDRDLISEDEKNRASAWLDSQIQRLGIFISKLGKGDVHAFNDYVNNFDDPFSRPNDAKRPSWHQSD